MQHHCPTNPNDCHTHDVQTIGGVATGSFSAPDHEYPSWLELVLTATDSGGLTGTTSVRLDPKIVVLSFATTPTGLDLSVGSTTSTAPFTRTVIQNSRNTITAPAQQTVGGTTYNWQSWSDAGARSHDIFAPATATTYTATYAAAQPPADVRVTQAMSAERVAGHHHGRGHERRAGIGERGGAERRAQPEAQLRRLPRAPPAAAPTRRAAAR